MFGVRTEADAAATRAATPKARELFRRELQRVPVHYELSGGSKISAVRKEKKWDPKKTGTSFGTKNKRLKYVKTSQTLKICL